MNAWIRRLSKTADQVWPSLVLAAFGAGCAYGWYKAKHPDGSLLGIPYLHELIELCAGIGLAIAGVYAGLIAVAGSIYVLVKIGDLARAARGWIRWRQ